MLRFYYELTQKLKLADTDLLQDPAYFGGHYILDNYCAVEEAFSLTVEEWTSICKASIGGSWCSTDRKNELLASLEFVVGQWR